MTIDQVKKIGGVSAAAIVVANMIGTGVFTTLGQQLELLDNPWVVLSLWVVGGVIALFGAISYAELGTKFPESGGEYHFLSSIFHPFIGYLSGWVSLTVGFATSISLSAMSIGDYLKVYVSMPSGVIAILAIVLLTFLHSFDLERSSWVQNVLTFFKVILIFGLIVGGFFLTGNGGMSTGSTAIVDEVFSSNYAVALVMVMYAYSGWNAAVYIIDEIDNPRKNLPFALMGGTILVTILFVLLQWTFLKHTGVELLRNKVEVGQVVANQMFGLGGGVIVSILISFFLTASISAMIWVGPRVTRAIADKYKIWSFFAKDNNSGIPVRAIWLQAFISILMVMTSTFDQILTYSGFILQIFTTLTVFGVIVARYKKLGEQDFYKSPGFPLVQIIFLIISLWVLYSLLMDKPRESLFGLINILAGALSFYWNKVREKYFE